MPMEHPLNVNIIYYLEPITSNLLPQTYYLDFGQNGINTFYVLLNMLNDRS
jgi:hypothetical protein